MSRRTLLTCVVVVALLVVGGLLLVRAVDPGQTDAGVTSPTATPTPTPSSATSPGATPAPSPGAALGRCPRASDGRIGTDPFNRTVPAHSPRPEPSPSKARMQICPARAGAAD